MTKVERAQNFRTCNICCSKKDVYNVTFLYEGTKSGTEVAMCKECINKTVDVFKAAGIVKDDLRGNANEL